MTLHRSLLNCHVNVNKDLMPIASLETMVTLKPHQLEQTLSLKTIWRPFCERSSLRTLKIRMTSPSNATKSLCSDVKTTHLLNPQLTQSPLLPLTSLQKSILGARENVRAKLLPRCQKSLRRLLPRAQKSLRKQLTRWDRTSWTSVEEGANLQLLTSMSHKLVRKLPFIRSRLQTSRLVSTLIRLMPK